MPSDAFTKLISNPESEKEYLVEMKAGRLIGETIEERTFYISVRGSVYNENYYFPAVKDIPRIKRSTQGISGPSVPSWGTLTINIEDGFYISPMRDVTFNDLISDWYLTGYPITIKLGGKSLEYTDFETIFSGKQGTTKWDDATIQIPCVDGIGDLRKIKLPVNQFPEGGNMPEATAGRFIPVCLGEHIRIAPELVHTNLLVYQIHDPAVLGPVSAITAVYDSGTPVAFTPDLPNCRFTLASAPAGNVTCDVKGATINGTYIEKVGDIIDALMDWAGLSAQVDAGMLADFKAGMDVRVKLFQEDPADLQVVLDKLISGLPCWYGFDRQGIFQVQELSVTSDPVIELSPVNILDESLRGEHDKDLWWEIFLGYRHDYEEQRYKYLPDSDPVLKTLCPWALSTKIQSYLLDKTDAETVIAKWRVLRGIRRERYTLTTKMLTAQMVPGDVVSLTWPKFNIVKKPFVILGFNENLIRNRIELEILG